MDVDQRNNPAVRQGALDALNLARAGDLTAALQLVTSLGRDYGPTVTYALLLMWCDTLVVLEGLDGAPAGEVAGPRWRTGDGMRDPVPPDDVSVEQQWTADLMMARLLKDEAGYDAVLACLADADPVVIGRHVAVLLASVASTLNCIADVARRARLQ
jgi:hypothetical protein